jgi:hypothetical protein
VGAPGVMSAGLASWAGGGSGVTTDGGGVETDGVLSTLGALNTLGAMAP